jgi:anaerobic selenocysteine-containing dehydrogenase
MPESGKMEDALKQLDLLVSIDIFRNATGEYAHYILPATTYLQHPDFNFLFQSLMGITNFPFLTYSDTVREPEGEQKEEMWIFRQLAKACGIHLFGSPLLSFLLAVEEGLSSLPLVGKWFSLTSRRLFNLILVVTGTSSVRKLRKKPEGINLEPFKPGSFLGKRVYTSSGKVDLAPPKLRKAAESVAVFFREEETALHEMRLVNMRQLLSHNTYFNNGPTFLRRMGGGNVAYMNPADAAQRDLKEGDRVEVSTEYGSITLGVEITEDIMEKCIAVPWGWGQQKAAGLSVASGEQGANVNLLTGSGMRNIDPVSGMAHLTAVPVLVRKAGSAE